jgi:ABC-type lipoprotein export system ATPase subunit
MNRLIAKNITQTYDGNCVLNSASIEVCSRDSVAIIGKSGSGKSTLLQVIAGLSTPDSGEVIFGNKDKKYDLLNISESDMNLLRKEHFGFIYQQHFLLKDFTVLDNLLLASNDLSRAVDLLDKLGLMGKENSYYYQLSGGERQRVSICRALMNKPSILFADEPTGNLDSETTQVVWDLLIKLQKSEGFGIFLVTHDINLAEKCNRKIEIISGIIK